MDIFRVIPFESNLLTIIMKTHSESEFLIPRMEILKAIFKDKLRLPLQQLMVQRLETQMLKMDPPSQTTVHVAC